MCKEQILVLTTRHIELSFLIRRYKTVRSFYLFFIYISHILFEVKVMCVLVIPPRVLYYNVAKRSILAF